MSEFKKRLRLRQRVRYKTIGFNEQTNGLHVRYNFWYISLPHSAKQLQREMTKFKFYWVRGTHDGEFLGAFFWDYSGYSYSGLGITEYTNFIFQKNAHSFWKRNTHGGGDLRTTTSSNRKPGDRRGRLRWISRQKFPKRTRILRIPSKPYSVHSVHFAIGSRMNGMIFRSFRKQNSSQKNKNTVYSE